MNKIVLLDITEIPIEYVGLFLLMILCFIIIMLIENFKE